MSRPVRSGILSRRLRTTLAQRIAPPPDAVPAHIVAALGGDPSVPARKVDPPAAIVDTNAAPAAAPESVPELVRRFAGEGMGRRRIVAELRERGHQVTEHAVRRMLTDA